MSDEKAIPSEPDDDALASEYVLGVLDAAERERCQQRIVSDREFARRVAYWEMQFSSLNDSVTPVAPPASVKRALDAQLFPDAQPTQSVGIWSSLFFWRALSAVSLALVAVLVFFLASDLVRAPDGREMLVASLRAPDTDAEFIAHYNRNTNSLNVAVLSGDKADTQDYEIWLIEDANAAPVSLGLVGQSQSLSTALAPAFKEEAILAISLEPKGGSPGSGPSGPVIATGQIKKI